MKTFSEDAHEQVVEAAVGERFAIRLRENPTTGFRWQIEAGGAPICVLGGDEFEPPAGAPGVAGREGAHRWEFRVERAGEARIHLVSRRAWEEADASARAFTLRIRSRG